MRQLLERNHYQVVMIGERRTSKACFECGVGKGVYAINTPMYTTDSTRPWRVEPGQFEDDGKPVRCRIVLHGQIRCSCCGLARCRDLNAVRNMLVIVEAALNNEPRPEYLASMEATPATKPWTKRHKPRERSTTTKPVAHSRNERRRIKSRAQVAAAVAAVGAVAGPRNQRAVALALRQVVGEKRLRAAAALERSAVHLKRRRDEQAARRCPTWSKMDNFFAYLQV